MTSFLEQYGNAFDRILDSIENNHLHERQAQEEESMRTKPLRVTVFKIKQQKDGSLNDAPLIRIGW